MSVRALLLPALLAASLGLASAAALAAPQDAAPRPQGAAPAARGEDAGRADRLRAARDRWARMSPEQRDRIRRRFEEWQRLPAERRETLARRCEELGGPEGVGLAHRSLEALRIRSPEKLARMRQQSENFRRVEAGLLEGLLPAARARYDALGPEDREKVRFQLGRALLGMAREQMVRDHATEEERRVLREGGPEERKAARKSLFARVQKSVLEPHRKDLEALPQDRRRERMAALLEESLWRRVREERVGDIRAAFLRFVQENGGHGGRFLAARRDKFRGDFGVSPEELGSPGEARALLVAASLVPPERREAWLAEIRPEVRRIVDGVAPELRGEELRALLQRLRDR